MIRTLAAAMLGAVLLAKACGATDVGPEQAVSALMCAWNQHDPHAFASQFAQDATFVNVNGWLWIGQKEIEDRHARAGIFKSSHAEIKPRSVRFLGSDVAVVLVSWTITGDPRDPQARQDRHDAGTLATGLRRLAAPLPTGCTPFPTTAPPAFAAASARQSLCVLPPGSP